MPMTAATLAGELAAAHLATAAAVGAADLAFADRENRVREGEPG